MLIIVAETTFTGVRTFLTGTSHNVTLSAGEEAQAAILLREVITKSWRRSKLSHLNPCLSQGAPVPHSGPFSQS